MPGPAVLTRNGLDRLVEVLKGNGHRVVGPTVRDNAVVLAELDSAADHVERWQHWASCFEPGFSYVHGGEVRTSAASRYRQWVSHKLLAATFRHVRVCRVWTVRRVVPGGHRPDRGSRRLRARGGTEE